MILRPQALGVLRFGLEKRWMPEPVLELSLFRGGDRPRPLFLRTMPELAYVNEQHQYRQREGV